MSEELYVIVVTSSGARIMKVKRQADAERPSGAERRVGEDQMFFPVAGAESVSVDMTFVLHRPVRPPVGRLVNQEGDVYLPSEEEWAQYRDAIASKSRHSSVEFVFPPENEALADFAREYGTDVSPRGSEPQ